ncbi:MAG TPA: ATP-NAD kinase, partial [Actinobacteria bacterium]|nr:ATP-NAD kinase [Actinomycetota bacterium]
MSRVGLVVNPIAGMGGRVGLKGTDRVADVARAAGAEPVAPGRVSRFLEAFVRMQRKDPDLEVHWLTCAGEMGADALDRAGAAPADVEVVHTPATPTTAEDTKAAAAACVRSKADRLLCCGGDGNARDVAEAIAGAIPVLGIPSGVKMHSGVFAVDPKAAAEALAAFLRGQLRTGDSEILDLDEDAYRAGEWRVRLYAKARTLVEPNLVQADKMMFAEMSEESVLLELAEHFRDLFQEEPGTLYLLGPGSTLESIAKRLRLEKTLLGIDAAVGGKTVAKDLDERRILDLLNRHPKAKLVVSPIGAQGFVLGRGNLQVSPEVMRR